MLLAVMLIELVLRLIYRFAPDVVVGSFLSDVDTDIWDLK